jgi:peptidoglycan/xylan/chitin deacetylase (PgdA/CDA1 family)
VRGVGWLAELARTRVTGVRIVHARRGPGTPRAVALTFDDGPSEWTPPILDAFARHGGVGTFFVLGVAIAGREDVLRRVVAEGHELGNHAYSHTDPAALGDEALLDEIDRTTALVEGAAGARPRLFRPPYAAYDTRVARVARSAGLTPTVLRSIDPADWREADAGLIVSRVLDSLRPGAIVCLHDALPPTEPKGSPDRCPTVAAVPAILDGLAARGYAAVTVSQLLA